MDKRTITMKKSNIVCILSFSNFCVHKYCLDNKNTYNFQKES